VEVEFIKNDNKLTCNLNEKVQSFEKVIQNISKSVINYDKELSTSLTTVNASFTDVYNRKPFESLEKVNDYN
jgi:hypothetical protein